MVNEKFLNSVLKRLNGYVVGDKPVIISGATAKINIHKNPSTLEFLSNVSGSDDVEVMSTADGVCRIRGGLGWLTNFVPSGRWWLTMEGEETFGEVKLRAPYFGIREQYGQKEVRVYCRMR